MKKLIVATALVALIGSPAFARTPPGTNPYRAFAAVTPNDAGPDVSGSPRAEALTDCAKQSRAYSEPTWADMQMHQWRSCMAERGQME